MSLRAPSPNSDTVGVCHGCMLILDGEDIKFKLADNTDRTAPARFGLDGSFKQCAALGRDGDCSIGRISSEATRELIRTGIDLASIPKPCVRKQP